MVKLALDSSDHLRVRVCVLGVRSDICLYDVGYFYRLVPLSVIPILDFIVIDVPPDAPVSRT